MFPVTSTARVGAQAQHDQWDALQTAWNDYLPQWNSFQTQILNAYDTYATTEKDAFVTAHTNIATDVENAAIEVADAKKTRDLANNGHLTEYYAKWADYTMTYDKAVATADYQLEIELITEQQHKNQIDAAEDAFEADTQEADKDRIHKTANSNLVYDLKVISENYDLVVDRHAEELTLQTTVLNARYGTSGLEYQLADITYSDTIALAQAKATQLAALAVLSPTAWNVQASDQADAALAHATTTAAAARDQAKTNADETKTRLEEEGNARREKELKEADAEKERDTKRVNKEHAEALDEKGVVAALPRPFAKFTPNLGNASLTYGSTEGLSQAWFIGNFDQAYPLATYNPSDPNYLWDWEGSAFINHYTNLIEEIRILSATGSGDTHYDWEGDINVANTGWFDIGQFVPEGIVDVSGESPGDVVDLSGPATQGILGVSGYTVGGETGFS